MLELPGRTLRSTGTAIGDEIVEEGPNARKGRPTPKRRTGSTPPPPGQCSAPAWSSATAYSGGAVVQYGTPAHKWTAKWWTQADTPGGAAGVWTDNGPC